MANIVFVNIMVRMWFVIPWDKSIEWTSVNKISLDFVP